MSNSQDEASSISTCRPAQAFRELDVFSHMRFWFVAGGVLSLDLWSKERVFAAIPSGQALAVIPRTLEFRRSLNDGAVFGSFTGYAGVFIIASIFALGFVIYLFSTSRRTQWILHVSLGLILAGAMGNLYDRAFIHADIITYALHSGQTTSIIGKIVSTPSDRMVRIGDWPEGTNARSFERHEVTVRRQGVVRDFLKFVFKFPRWVPRLGGRDVWPWIFNVADTGLVCGVGLLVLSGMWDRSRQRRNRPNSAEPSWRQPARTREV